MKTKDFSNTWKPRQIMAKGRPKSKIQTQNMKIENKNKVWKIKFYFNNIWKHEHEKKKTNKTTMQNCILN
jgi:hypothetical protein